MSMKDIEKEILDREKEVVLEIKKSLNKILDNPDKKNRLIKNIIKLGSKENIELEESDVMLLLDDFWYILAEDADYSPGFVDEYKEKMIELFFGKKGVSMVKLGEYIYNKYLDL